VWSVYIKIIFNFTLFYKKIYSSLNILVYSVLLVTCSLSEAAEITKFDLEDFSYIGRWSCQYTPSTPTMETRTWVPKPLDFVCTELNCWSPFNGFHAYGNTFIIILVFNKGSVPRTQPVPLPSAFRRCTAKKTTAVSPANIFIVPALVEPKLGRGRRAGRYLPSSEHAVAWRELRVSGRVILRRKRLRRRLLGLLRVSWWQVRLRRSQEEPEVSCTNVIQV
jgi:hypothetical protein